ncbi:MAG: 4Fe-4S dicluster domain-containing protein, partial [Caulobacteraceae bacterium]|nr:4Fe-4S dicluster domain-containing protein [Caulobacter sp.]
PAQVGTSRAWALARQASAKAGKLLTLHSAAPTPGLTSAKADYHVAVNASDLPDIVARLGAEVGTPTAPEAGDLVGQWVKRAGAALAAARGRGIVTAGAAQPAAVHEAVHRLNDALGNNGGPVFFTAPVVAAAAPFEDLVRAMAGGAVKSLVMLDTNPVYTAPGDLDFTEAIQKVPLRIQCGTTVDETSAYADWHLPRAHPLESWGDARAWDGTVSLYQPTVYPLYDGRSDLEVLSILTDPQPRDGLAILRDAHAEGRDPNTFDAFWRGALLDGFVANTAFAPETVALVPARPAAARPAREPGLLDVAFRPDPTIWTGGSANNGWLQELPKPLTKVVWSNYVAVSPALAEREHLASGDMVRIAVGGASVEGPAWILPGQAPDAVTLYLGYGRTVPDMLFSGLGYTAFPLRAASTPGSRTGATLTRLGPQIRLATTQDHSTIEGHDIVRVHRVGGPAVESFPTDAPSFYDFTARKGEEDGRAWGMVIDQDACIGCNACVVACQAENNIPVVGAHEVSIGREMHWLRVDRYYSGLKTGAGLDDPDTHFQPVPCMHCEEAPCEVGCPVEATLHDHEG